MKHAIWFLILSSLVLGGAAMAQEDGCESAFADVNAFTAEVYEKSTAEIVEGVIAWESADWENIVRQVVGASEYYLNNCTDLDLPLWEQLEAVQELAAMSHILPSVETVDIGGDFSEVQLITNFKPSTGFIDFNGDGQEEMFLNTQVPYFSDKTVYMIQGGLSIAFFDDENDGWQGQVIAPVTEFVTTGDHLTYAQTEENTLSVESAEQALKMFPTPEIQVVDVDGTPLTFITTQSSTGAGTAKELDVLSWDGRIPSVELRVSFDDWCYPGATLDWTIGDDGSVTIPTNGNEEGSALHCGRTPEATFTWDGEGYK
jgi:hypothetical protein